MFLKLKQRNYYLIIIPILLIITGFYFQLPLKVSMKAKSFLNQIKISRLIKTSNCSIPEINEIPENSTIIIGHLYGKPLTQNNFIDKNAEKFLLVNKKNIKNLFLTGDIFATPSLKKWKKLYYFLGKDINILIAPGNHDVGEFSTNKIFNESVKQNKHYPIIFEEGNNVFIFENSIASRWHIQEKTLKKIKKINKNKKVYLLRHNIASRELIPLANSRTFLQKGLPDFRETNSFFDRKLTIISGDGGAFKNLPRIFCTSYANIKYIINGIGGLKGDTILIIYNEKIFRYILD